MLSDEDRKDISLWIKAAVDAEFCRKKIETHYKEEVEMRDRIVFWIGVVASGGVCFVMGLIVGKVVL